MSITKFKNLSYRKAIYENCFHKLNNEELYFLLFFEPAFPNAYELWALRVGKIEFYETKDLYGELSNYYSLKTPILYNGKTYATSEHLYQTMKFLYTDASDETKEYAEVIRVQKTPNMAKILASQKISGGYAWRIKLNGIIKAHPNAKIDPNWEEVKIDKMKIVVNLKFTQDKHCRNILLSTGDKVLYEHTTRDLFWADGGNKTGQNMLGKILMEERKIIKN